MEGIIDKTWEINNKPEQKSAPQRLLKRYEIQPIIIMGQKEKASGCSPILIPANATKIYNKTSSKRNKPVAIQLTVRKNLLLI